jgi:hypothetical protein
MSFNPEHQRLEAGRSRLQTGHENTLSSIFAGRQHVASFLGHAPCTTGSDIAYSSGCLAALNCARVVLQQDACGTTGKALVASLLSRETMKVRWMSEVRLDGLLKMYSQEICDVCYRWIGSTHLEVEDIHATAVFKHSLFQEETRYESLGISPLCELLRYGSLHRSNTAILKRTPDRFVKHPV